jgi:hypothetical protein
MAIVSLPLPITLLNGTTADAGQVMTDLNAIASNVNANAAKNGVNNDITQLSALIALNPGLTITGASIGTSSFSNGSIIGSTIDSTTTAVTQPLGTNTNQIATMAALIQQAFSAILPALPTDNSPYQLNAKSGIVSWGISNNPYVYYTAGGF